jgi:hypothetical protein
MRFNAKGAKDAEVAKKKRRGGACAHRSVSLRVLVRYLHRGAM